MLEKEGGRPMNTRNRLNVAIVNTLWRIMTGERLEHDSPKAERITQSMDNFLQVGRQHTLFMLQKIAKSHEKLCPYKNT